jgi:hypothetical protein
MNFIQDDTKFMHTYSQVHTAWFLILYRVPLLIIQNYTDINTGWHTYILDKTGVYTVW